MIYLSKQLVLTQYSMFKGEGEGVCRSMVKGHW